LRKAIVVLFLLLLGLGVGADRLTTNSTPFERTKDLVFAARPDSAANISSNGGTVTGSPTYSTHGTTGGVTLDGTNDDIDYDINPTTFDSTNISIVIEFTPHFAYDEDATRYLIDTTNGEEYSVVKMNAAGSNELVIKLGDTEIAAIASGTYSAEWTQNARNTLVISGTTGATDARLNDTQILTADATAWTKDSPVNLHVGTEQAGGSRFDGVIHSVKVYQSLLTSYDATAIYNNTWNRPSLIQTLIDASDLVLWHDYRSGSLTDFSGQGNHGTGTDIDWQGGGVRFNASTSQIAVTDAAELQLTELTLIVCGDFRSQSNQYLISKRDAGGTNYDLYIGATAVILYDGTNSRSRITDVTGAECIAVAATNGETGDVYIDGVLDGALSDTSSLSVDDAPLLVGNYHTGSFQLNASTHAALIVDRELTATEMNQIYTELRGMRWPRRKSGTGQGSYGAELITNGDIETGDTTGWTAGNSATLTAESGGPMAGDYVIRIAHNGTNNPYAGQTILTSGSRYRITFDARGDGVEASAIPRIRIWTSGTTLWTGTNSATWTGADQVFTADDTQLLLYTNLDAAGYVEFDNISVKEVQGNWIQYKTGYGATAGNTNFTAGQVENTDFIRSTGTWKVTTDTVNGKTAKVLECVAAGIAYVDARLLQGSPTLDAYGTWEWWFYRGSTGNDLRVGFIADAVAAQPGYNGYEITMSGAERIYLYEMNGAAAGTKCRTDDAAFVQQTWYQLRITRSGAGEFSLYLDGTLVDMTGGSGTNPTTDATYTTSNYILLEFDAGDKISLGSTDGDENLFKLQGVVAP
jgi:hypothetical protein